MSLLDVPKECVYPTDKTKPSAPVTAEPKRYNEEDGVGDDESSSSSSSSDEAEEEKEDAAKSKPEREGSVSKQSFVSNATSSSKFPYAQEISETFATKIRPMFICIFAVFVNIGLMIFTMELGKGMLNPFAAERVHQTGAIVIEILLLLSNIITIIAMDVAFGVYFGYRLTQKKGYSLAVCGFNQSSSIKKLGYTSELSLNSSARKTLFRLGWVWMIAELLKLLTPIPATAISGKTYRYDYGTVQCIEFGQFMSPTDRGWPNFRAESGFSEVAFGSALGILRAEGEANFTTTFMSPNIIGEVAHGDTIVGDGYQTIISTICNCTDGDQPKDLAQFMSQKNNDLALEVASSLLEEFERLDRNLGIATHFTLDLPAKKVVATSLLSGSSICGGMNNDYLTVCTTTLSDHHEAMIQVSYMTDGSPASIAPESAILRKLGKEADIYWVYKALVNIHEGAYSSHRLPLTVPGALNPLLWWTSTDLLSIDPSHLESGIEAFFAVLLRGGIQRTFSVEGKNCIRNVEADQSSIMHMAEYGVQCCYLLLAVQLFMSVGSILAFIPWFLSTTPIGPAVRIVRQNVYFLTFLNNCAMITGFETMGNGSAHTIWQNLDVIVRVGESPGTLSETIGHLTMDKPKLVRPMSNGRKYY